MYSLVVYGRRKHTNQLPTKKSASSRIYARFKPNKVHCVLPRYLSRRPVPHLHHFCLRLRLHIDPQRYMVRENTRINLKRENQPLVEYMPVSSPTKCIACSLDTYRGALYPIFFTFASVFAFISISEDTWWEKTHESTSNEKISL